MIRILLVDDHPTMRFGVRVLLEREADMAVVGECAEGSEALRLVEVLHPDVVLLDCKLPDMSGVAVAAELQRRALPSRVLALSAYEDKHFVRGMVAAGALGYLMKEETPHAIVRAVRCVARGERWGTPTESPDVPHGDVVAALSEREREVLRGVVAGQTNRQIGHTLSISEKTVEKHMAALFAKFQSQSRAEVVAMAIRSGLL